MIAYTMIGVSDLPRAIDFYKPLFAQMGMEICWQGDTCASFGIVDDESVPRFFIGYPFDGGAASVGNGTMTAFRLQSPEQVVALHKMALENGGRDVGEPGYRPQYGEGFYAAYVRDSDGNKLAFVVYP
ncbi:VOC family protein [Pseudoalteromonas sp. BDTF-M6]|uniref:VOC family protein n=1 Tax=Pseudoalteromonas sp. BDTF-M6 TaxID=2796132 RepID=UPI001BAF3BF5|nr:VOC family protein [Pseudoalteromonas sp. BDTF-M6]MBS3796884.1 VOC family protein [Pseudoalteromonas sp. BDTF-M6]